MKENINMLIVVIFGWKNLGFYFLFPCVFVLFYLTVNMHYTSNQKCRRSVHLGEQRRGGRDPGQNAMARLLEVECPCLWPGKWLLVILWELLHLHSLP